MRNIHTPTQDHLGQLAEPPNKKCIHHKKINEENLGGAYYKRHTLKSEGTHMKVIFTGTIRARRYQAIHTSPSHIPLQECPYRFNNPAFRAFIYNMNHLSIQSTFSSQNETITFCNKSQQNEHRRKKEIPYKEGILKNIGARVGYTVLYWRDGYLIGGTNLDTPRGRYTRAVTNSTARGL